MNSARLVIPGTLPSLNDYTGALDKSRHAGAALKKEAQRMVEWCVKPQLWEFRPTGLVWMECTWYERNRKCDKDNISSFGRKAIQDGLVKAGVLGNDGRKHIEGFWTAFGWTKSGPAWRLKLLK